MLNYIETWKSLANNKAITAINVAEYCILRAVKAKTPKTFEERLQIAHSLLIKAFTPVKNAVKLANGRSPYDTLKSSVRFIKWSTNYKANQLHLFGQPANVFLSEEEITLFVELVRKLSAGTETLRQYAYFIVDSQLSPEQKAVQAAHVALKFGVQNNAPYDPDTLHFVVLEHDDLQSKIEYLQSAKQPLTTFVDYGKITAIAAGPIDWDSGKRNHFAGDRLLRFTT